MTAPLVSVVVPTRNRAGLLPALLEALADQEYEPYEVVVVDDASTDGTPEILAAWEGPGRRVVRLPQSRGSYAARNAGWRAAGGEIIAFTDDDCRPSPDWLSALAASMEKGEAGAQGVTLPEPGEITPFTHQIRQTEPGPPDRTCNIAYRRSVLEDLGGFDESFSWYADNIFGLRVRKEGAIAFVPEAAVRHPPRPREWRDRGHWRARFEADARHRQMLHQLGAEPVSAPRSALPVLLWILRPLAKQSLVHLRYLLRRPRSYLRQIGPMLVEKRELLVAMREFYRGEGRELEPNSPLPALPERPLASVVVVTRDRPELLSQALAALEEQTWQPREVIVVDNGADLEIEAKGVRVIPAPRVSLGAARQKGVEAAAGEIVAFTDDDCLPAPDWLTTITDALQRNPSWWGVQGRTMAEEGPVGAHVVDIPRFDPLFQTCNIAYRREAIQEAGGFDPGFSGWFEDTALGAKVQARGTIGFVGDAVVVHQAVPRRPLNRTDWRRLIADERRLAREYPSFYRRVRGPNPMVVFVARWLIGSPLKTILRALPRATSEPRQFLSLVLQLARERWELAQALRSERTA